MHAAGMHTARTVVDDCAAEDAGGLPQRLMGAAVEAALGAGPPLSAPPAGAVPDAPGAGSGAFVLAGSGDRVATSAWTVRLMAGWGRAVRRHKAAVRRAHRPDARCAPWTMRSSSDESPKSTTSRCWLSALTTRTTFCRHQKQVARQRRRLGQRGRRFARTPLRGVAQLTIFWNGNSLRGRHSASGRHTVFEASPALARLPSSPGALSAACGCLRHGLSTGGSVCRRFAAGAA